MNYCIFRVAPIQKLKDLGQIGAHNQRKKEAYKSNPDIDETKSKKNIELIPLSASYRQGFNKITRKYKAEHDLRQETIRSDRKRSFHQMVDDSKSVVADELLFTATHDFFKDMNKRSIKKWARCCMDFVYEDLGYSEEQILHSIIHMDEKTPHLHVVVIPLIKKFDKRSNTERYTISKKQYIKDKTHLSELQDKYHERLVSNGFDLNRGIKNSDNEHIAIKEFKKITQKLDSRLEQQNFVLSRDYKILAEKFENSKPTISGKEVKIDKDTYNILRSFMNTTKNVIEEMPRNQALYLELENYTSKHKQLEKENSRLQTEVDVLKYKNNQLQIANEKLHRFIKQMAQTFKEFFRKILKLDNDQNKNEVIEQIKDYHEKKIYQDKDLTDIANDTTKEKEIKIYLNHSKDKSNEFRMKL